MARTKDTRAAGKSSPRKADATTAGAGTSRMRLVALVAVAAVAGAAVGVASSRSGTSDLDASLGQVPSAIVREDPLAPFDESDADAFLGARVSGIVLETLDGAPTPISPDDGRPKVLLLVGDCSDCVQVLSELAGHLQQADYDPGAGRYDLYVISTDAAAVDALLGEAAWTLRQRVFAGDSETLTHYGFDPSQLPAWFFMYPDGTLAGREVGSIDFDQYRRTTTLLAATIP